MLKLSGNLSIRTINGRNGDFNVATLVTDIGEFAVRNALLDQYDEGRYEGEFGISRIFLGHYQPGNRMVIEIRATIETMALLGIDELGSDQTSLITEPDPADEAPAQPAIKSDQAIKPDDPIEPLTSSCGGPNKDDNSLEDLFGTLWPLNNIVKLDPTVDRKLLRNQRDKLRELGYQFFPLGQHWKLEG